MKDVLRDELEIKIFFATAEDATHGTIIAALNDALRYVQNNPSIDSIELAHSELESNLHIAENYDEAVDTIAKYREAIFIMEKHA